MRQTLPKLGETEENWSITLVPLDDTQDSYHLIFDADLLAQQKFTQLVVNTIQKHVRERDNQ